MTANSRNNILVMGTRGSPLALAQSRQTAAALEAAHPGLIVEERIIRTTGDRQQSAPLPAIGGKGVFTLEIEEALLSGDIDFAVHSLKDLPPELPEGLCLAAIPKRAPACDVCVLREAPRSTPASTSLPFLPQNARVGTSSLRRSAQLLNLRPDLQIENIRGNIDTRLRKLHEQNFDAIILARAGLERLGIAAEYSELCPHPASTGGGGVQLPSHWEAGALRAGGEGLVAEYSSGRIVSLNEYEFVPAPGQGALAIEARANDDRTLELLSEIEDAPTRVAITAERAAMSALHAGCSTPLGAYATVANDQLHLHAVVLSVDGKRRIFGEEQGRVENAEEIGKTVARKLIESGADELLQS